MPQMGLQYPQRIGDGRSDFQHAGCIADRFADSLIRGVEAVQDGADFGAIGFAYGGWAHGAGCPRQQTSAQRLLKIRDILAGKTARHAHPPGSSGKAAFVQNTDECAKDDNIHAVADLIGLKANLAIRT